MRARQATGIAMLGPADQRNNTKRGTVALRLAGAGSFEPRTIIKYSSPELGVHSPVILRHGMALAPQVM
jgi:hypothetical protein